MTIVFDLDDTLFQEADFVKSAFRALARRFNCMKIAGLAGDSSTFHDAFDKAATELSLPVEKVIEFYRNHVPDISLDPHVERKLKSLSEQGITLALLTDGRSVTQRNKIRGLNLSRFFRDDLIFISEETNLDKTSPDAFIQVEKAAGNPPYIYVGDNPAKDFLQPRRLSWTTVMISGSGQNIHSQNLTGLPAEYHPDRVIDSIEELS